MGTKARLTLATTMLGQGIYFIYIMSIIWRVSLVLLCVGIWTVGDKWLSVCY